MKNDLDVRHCRVLVAVEKAGGIAAAARELRLAQSTVSETLASLERVVGTPVMIRRAGREAALTPAAMALLPYARVLISASEGALLAMSAHGRAVLRLGTVESVSSFVLPAPLRSFRGDQPQVDVQVTIGLCEDLRQRVRRGELDAAISLEGSGNAAESAGLTVRKLPSSAELVLVVSPRHPLAAARVSPAELKASTFLLADPDGAFNRLMSSWFQNPATPPRLESAGSIDGVKRSVLEGDAIAVLPSYAVAAELTAGSLTALKLVERLPTLELRVWTIDAPAAGSPIQSLLDRITTAAAEPLRAT